MVLKDRFINALSLAYRPKIIRLAGEGIPTPTTITLTLQEQILNGLILAGYSTFMAALGFGAAGILDNPRASCVGLILTFGGSFFGYMVQARGLKQAQQVQQGQG